MDKGTYDVISMNDENKEKRNRYKENIINLLQPKGMFLIVSCNWTQQELNEQFDDGKKLLKPLIRHQYNIFFFFLYSISNCVHYSNSIIPVWRSCW